MTTFREILRQRIDTFLSQNALAEPAGIIITQNMLPPPPEVITPHTGTLSTRGSREGASSMHANIIPSPKLSYEEHFKILARTAIHREKMQGIILLKQEGIAPRSGVLSINKR